jgi:hypothetical protein
VFRTLTVSGLRGSIVFGGRPAAVLGAWVARRNDRGVWTLSAVVDRVDTFQLRQIPLMFEGPRVSKPRGLWCFPVVPKSIAISGARLSADLGPPEG